MENRSLNSLPRKAILLATQAKAVRHRTRRPTRILGFHLSGARPVHRGENHALAGQSAAEEFNSLAHEVAHSLLHFTERRGETTKRVRETEAEAVAFVICEAIGLKAQNSADYIQLYSGDKETLVSSLECIQRTSAEILAAIAPSE